MLWDALLPDCLPIIDMLNDVGCIGLTELGCALTLCICVGVSLLRHRRHASNRCAPERCDCMSMDDMLDDVGCFSAPESAARGSVEPGWFQ